MRIMIKMRFKLILFTICLVLLSGCSSSLVAPEYQPSKEASMTLTFLSAQKTTIPSSMIGMNIELNKLCAILRTDDANRDAYEQLYKNLGTGTLHIGGHSVDDSLWIPDAQPACRRYTITRPVVQSLFAFARRIHWNVIWGLNFLADQPQMDADEAAYVNSVGRGVLLGFTVGNEPDLFPKNGLRPASWGYNNYLTQWNADRDAILTKVPSAHFFGPETASQTTWFPKFLQDEAPSNRLAAVSRHYYFYSGGNAKNSHITVKDILSLGASKQFALEARDWVSQANQYKVPVDISEMNTISNGGIRGVSDTFASALWASDILFQSVTLGINQIDFQQVPDAAYALINDQGAPQAIYNGILFFRLAAASSVLVPSVLNSSANISSYVLRDQNNNDLRAVLINNASQTINVAFVPGSAYHTMTTLHMQAPSLTSTSGLTIGNTTLTSGKAFTLPALPHTKLNASQVILSVPANSASTFTFSA